MGKNLHYSIPHFFETRMLKHDKVEKVVEVSTDHAYIYELTRAGRPAPMRVWLNDSYVFTETDYYDRPPLITKGDFILVARPEAMHDWQDVEMASQDGIGLGKIGKLMGALNRAEIWKYRTKEEIEDTRRRRQHETG